jgi:hypothetical protein
MSICNSEQKRVLKSAPELASTETIEKGCSL